MNRNIIPQKNCIYISPDSGVDPLIKARDAAVSGETIFVLPGVYEVPEREQLFKDGVNWHFMPGAYVSKTVEDLLFAGNAYGIFDDRATGAVTCKITGFGEFHMDAGQTTENVDEANATIIGMIVITDEDSAVHFQAKGLSAEAFWVPADILVGNLSVVRIDNTAGSYFDIGTITDTNYGTQATVAEGVDIPSSVNGLVWRFGDVNFKVNTIRVSNFGIIADQDSEASGSATLTVRADTIQQYFVNNAIYIHDGSLDTWRTNIHVGSLLADDESNDLYAVVGGGRHTINADIVYSPSATVAGANVNASAAGSPSVSINYGYVSTPEYALIVGSVATGNPVVSAELDFVEQNGAGQVASFGRGETTVRGGLWKSGNAQAVRHTGGSTRIKAVTIKSDSTNAATNYGINVSGSGLILDGCTIIAPALSESVYALSAQTVSVHNDTYTNKDKNANVTIQAGLGSLVVDAAVA